MRRSAHFHPPALGSGPNGHCGFSNPGKTRFEFNGKILAMAQQSRIQQTDDHGTGSRPDFQDPECRVAALRLQRHRQGLPNRGVQAAIIDRLLDGQVFRVVKGFV